MLPLVAHGDVCKLFVTWLQIFEERDKRDDVTMTQGKEFAVTPIYDVLLLAITNEPKAIGHTFLFTSQSQPPGPEQLWLEPCWFTPEEEAQSIALLAGE